MLSTLAKTIDPRKDVTMESSLYLPAISDSANGLHAEALENSARQAPTNAHSASTAKPTEAI